MRKLCLLILLMAVLILPSIASAIEYESITVADTAIGFTGSKIASYTTAFCTLETAQVRFRIDAVPTSSTGHILDVGGMMKFTSKELGVKFIRTGAVSATINCTYE